MSQGKEDKKDNILITSPLTSCLSSGPHSTPTDTFADTVITKVLQDHPPAYITFGTSSFKFWLMYYIPTFLRDYLYYTQFGLDQVKHVKVG
jgi:hypothetical protein